MSILCGMLEQHGSVVDAAELRRLVSSTHRYAAGNASVRVQDRIGMCLQPSFRHERLRAEAYPLIDQHGNMLCFDGRLDNRVELLRLLDFREPEVLDSEIVLAAFRRWGLDCFARLTGDWALALWSRESETLYLARDHAGTRTLYFRQAATTLVWATYLDTFLAEEPEQQLSSEYALCYLSGMALWDRTPYSGVASVPPGHVVAIRNGSISTTAHWTPFPSKTTRYGSIRDYDERFVELFGNAVSRRTDDGAPIIAQLSGGMDSTSIVCMSDHLRRRENANTDILDTLSYYDDSEQSLDEKAFFTITERYRGKVGNHINVAYAQRSFRPYEGGAGRYLVPGADSYTFDFEQRLDEEIWSRGYCCVLSGIGGDEVTGGIPDGRAELADYLISGQLVTFLQKSFAWSMVDRSPLTSTIYGAARYAMQVSRCRISPAAKPPAWLAKNSLVLVEGLRNIPIPAVPASSVRPTEMDNAQAWWSVMETLPHLFPHLLCRPEYRYPFLDKDLVEYLFSIPRELLLEPGRRRALMRRALVGIVPEEILERRRKAYQLRAPLKALGHASQELIALFQNSRLADFGLIQPAVLQAEIEQIANGNAGEWQAVIRAIAMELWLRSSESSENGKDDASFGREVHTSLTA